MNGDAYKALLALVLQKHKEMPAAEVCKTMWAMATLKTKPSRSVAVALSHVWLTDHLEAASLRDNSQMLWSLGSMYSHSNDAAAVETVSALLRRCREQIAEGNRNNDEDIDKCVLLSALSTSRLATYCSNAEFHCLPST